MWRPIESRRDLKGLVRDGLFGNTSGGQQALFAEDKRTGAAPKHRVVNPRPQQTVGSHPENREERFQRRLHRPLIWTMCPPCLSGLKRERKLQFLKRGAWFLEGKRRLSAHRHIAFRRFGRLDLLSRTTLTSTANEDTWIKSG